MTTQETTPKISQASDDEPKQLSKKQKYMYESSCFKCSRSMAFSAFTKWNCKICNSENEHHNSHTPTICIDCLKPYHCKFCGDCLTKARGQNQHS